MVVAQCLQTERCSEISSSLCFSCAMMGLQATSGKRKLEGGVGCMDFDMELGESPSKVGRVEGSWWAMEESYVASSGTTSLGQTSGSAYYDLDAPTAAACNSPCQVTAASAPAAPAAGLGQAATGQAQQAGPQATTPQPTSGAPSQQHYYQRSYSTGGGQSPVSRPQAQWGHHASAPHHYEPPTIRREENGKSYLELGSSYRANERCCEGSRSSWCRRGRACYRQRRLAVLNISMYKLARYRQFPDPSLHRSVLICNTLRYLEREMERDRSPPPMEPVLAAPMAQLQPPEQGRLTPFPLPASSSAETDVDSGIGDSDDSRSINWGSVLSLSSQSPLDPLNNNELLDVDIGPDLDLDFMPGWKLTSPGSPADELLRCSSPADNQPQQSQQQPQQPQQQQQQHHHHHHHHHQQQPSCTNVAGSGASGSSSTLESLMCVGS